MNETTIRNRPSKLEQLPPEMQREILEIAMNSRQVDALEALKEQGIEISASSLSRFIREHRQRLLMEDGEALKEGVEALAERGKAGKFRTGALEAARQRLYERV